MSAADPETGAEDGLPFRFTCRRSGNCCSIPGGFVRVTDVEVARIAAHLELDESGFRRRYLTPNGERLAPGLGHGCVFLSGGVTASCTIYPVRPVKCRTWPYWPELLDDPAALRRASALCPGIEMVEEVD